jgi:hypothetical protein
VADLRSTGTVDTRIYTNAGFKAPGQKGLAINSDYDSLYTDNSGSDAMYGGRIFELSDKKKQHVGSANYYSRDLSFAHPCSVMSLVKGHKDWTENFGKQLFLWDDLAREVKVLSLTYPEGADTFHNVAHRFFSFADAEVGAAIDMDVDKLEEGKVQIVYVLHSGGIIEITRSYNDLAGEWKVTSQTLMY